MHGVARASGQGALVFMRGTPRVVEGQTIRTGADSVASLTLVPNRQFPRSGFNVQFFIKAYRQGSRAWAASRATGSCRCGSRVDRGTQGRSSGRLPAPRRF